MAENGNGTHNPGSRQTVNMVYNPGARPQQSPRAPGYKQLNKRPDRETILGRR